MREEKKGREEWKTVREMEYEIYKKNVERYEAKYGPRTAAADNVLAEGAKKAAPVYENYRSAYVSEHGREPSWEELEKYVEDKRMAARCLRKVWETAREKGIRDPALNIAKAVRVREYTDTFVAQCLSEMRVPTLEEAKKAIGEERLARFFCGGFYMTFEDVYTEALRELCKILKTMEEQAEQNWARVGEGYTE